MAGFLILFMPVHYLALSAIAEERLSLRVRFAFQVE